MFVTDQNKDRCLMNPVSASHLSERLDAVPRVRFGAFPTPLQELPRLSDRLGGPRIFMKRDDLTGLGYGGNKVRKLEFAMADLVRDGVEVVVSGAAAQSNFCRQVAAAAGRLGMAAELMLMGPADAAFQGNLLLDDVFGADVNLVQAPGGWTELHASIASRVDTLRESGVNAAALTGFEPVGSVGYVAGMLELSHQCQEQDLVPDYLYVCSSTGTQAGLEVGARALGVPCRIVGVSATARLEWYPSISARLAEVANWVAQRLSLEQHFGAEDIENTTEYVGSAYAHATPEAREAIWMLAETEGLLVDPVYTGKALAGLIDHIRSGRIGAHESVVFVHTGGTPALFAYGDDVRRHRSQPSQQS